MHIPQPLKHIAFITCILFTVTTIANAAPVIGTQNPAVAAVEDLAPPLLSQAVLQTTDQRPQTTEQSTDDRQQSTGIDKRDPEINSGLDVDLNPSTVDRGLSTKTFTIHDSLFTELTRTIPLGLIPSVAQCTKLLHEGTVRYARTKKERKLLKKYGADALLMRDGRYLFRVGVGTAEKPSFRLKVLHEDIEALMQIIQHEDGSTLGKHKKRINNIPYYVTIKNFLRNRSDIITAYEALLSPETKKRLKANDDLYFNHLIATTFELIGAVLLEQLLNPKQESLLTAMVPFLKQNESFFDERFWDAGKRISAVRKSNGKFQVTSGFSAYGGCPDPSPYDDHDDEESTTSSYSYEPPDYSSELANIKNAQSAKDLEKYISHYASEVRFAAAAALKKMDEFTPERQAIYYAFSGNVEESVKLGKTAVPALIKALKDSDKDVRKAAAEALGKIGDKSAVPALIKALKDGYWQVRTAAAAALGKIGDKSAVPALIEALKDKDSDVRTAAAEALGTIGDTRAVPALIEALKDWRSVSTAAAAAALKKMDEFTPERQAIYYAFSGNVEESVKLGEIAVPALVEAIKAERYVRENIRALGLIKDERALPTILRNITKYASAVEATSMFGDKSLSETIVAVMKNTDKSIRIAAKNALRQLKTYGFGAWNIYHRNAITGWGITLGIVSGGVLALIPAIGWVTGLIVGGSIIAVTTLHRIFTERWYSKQVKKAEAIKSVMTTSVAEQGDTTDTSEFHPEQAEGEAKEPGSNNVDPEINSGSDVDLNQSTEADRDLLTIDKLTAARDLKGLTEVVTGDYPDNEKEAAAQAIKEVYTAIKAEENEKGEAFDRVVNAFMKAHDAAGLNDYVLAIGSVGALSDTQHETVRDALKAIKAWQETVKPQLDAIAGMAEKFDFAGLRVYQKNEHEEIALAADKALTDCAARILLIKGECDSAFKQGDQEAIRKHLNHPAKEARDYAQQVLVKIAVEETNAKQVIEGALKDGNRKLIEKYRSSQFESIVTTANEALKQLDEKIKKAKETIDGFKKEGKVEELKPYTTDPVTAIANYAKKAVKTVQRVLKGLEKKITAAQAKGRFDLLEEFTKSRYGVITVAATNAIAALNHEITQKKDEIAAQVKAYKYEALTPYEKSMLGDVRKAAAEGKETVYQHFVTTAQNKKAEPEKRIQAMGALRAIADPRNSDVFKNIMIEEASGDLDVYMAAMKAYRDVAHNIAPGGEKDESSTNTSGTLNSFVLPAFLVSLPLIANIPSTFMLAMFAKWLVIGGVITLIAHAFMYISRARRMIPLALGAGVKGSPYGTTIKAFANEKAKPGLISYSDTEETVNGKNTLLAGETGDDKKNAMEKIAYQIKELRSRHLIDIAADLGGFKYPAIQDAVVPLINDKTLDVSDRLFIANMVIDNMGWTNEIESILARLLLAASATDLALYETTVNKILAHDWLVHPELSRAVAEYMRGRLLHIVELRNEMQSIAEGNFPVWDDIDDVMKSYIDALSSYGTFVATAIDKGILQNDACAETIASFLGDAKLVQLTVCNTGAALGAHIAGSYAEAEACETISIKAIQDGWLKSPIVRHAIESFVAQPLQYRASQAIVAQSIIENNGLLWGDVRNAIVEYIKEGQGEPRGFFSFIKEFDEAVHWFVENFHSGFNAELYWSDYLNALKGKSARDRLNSAIIGACVNKNEIPQIEAAVNETSAKDKGDALLIEILNSFGTRVSPADVQKITSWEREIQPLLTKIKNARANLDYAVIVPYLHHENKAVAEAALAAQGEIVEIISMLKEECDEAKENGEVTTLLKLQKHRLQEVANYAGKLYKELEGKNFDGVLKRWIKLFDSIKPGSFNYSKEVFEQAGYSSKMIDAFMKVKKDIEDNQGKWAFSNENEQVRAAAYFYLYCGSEFTYVDNWRYKTAEVYEKNYIKGLQDPSLVVQYAVLRDLGSRQAGRYTISELIAKKMKSKIKEIRYAAICAFGENNSADSYETIAVLTKYIRDKNNPPDRRRKAVEVLSTSCPWYEDIWWILDDPEWKDLYADVSGSIVFWYRNEYNDELKDSLPTMPREVYKYLFSSNKDVRNNMRQLIETAKMRFKERHQYEEVKEIDANIAKYKKRAAGKKRKKSNGTRKLGPIVMIGTTLGMLFSLSQSEVKAQSFDANLPLAQTPAVAYYDSARTLPRTTAYMNERIQYYIHAVEADPGFMPPYEELIKYYLNTAYDYEQAAYYCALAMQHETNPTVYSRYVNYASRIVDGLLRWQGDPARAYDFIKEAMQADAVSPCTTERLTKRFPQYLKRIFGYANGMGKIWVAASRTDAIMKVLYDANDRKADITAAEMDTVNALFDEVMEIAPDDPIVLYNVAFHCRKIGRQAVMMFGMRALEAAVAASSLRDQKTARDIARLAAAYGEYFVTQGNVPGAKRASALMHAAYEKVKKLTGKDKKLIGQAEQARDQRPETTESTVNRPQSTAIQKTNPSTMDRGPSTKKDDNTPDSSLIQVRTSSDAVTEKVQKKFGRRIQAIEKKYPHIDWIQAFHLNNTLDAFGKYYHGSSAHISPYALRNKRIFEGVVLHEQIHYMLKNFTHHPLSRPEEDVIASTIEMRHVMRLSYERDVKKGLRLGTTLQQTVDFLKNEDAIVFQPLKRMLNRFTAVSGGSLAQQIELAKRFSAMRHGVSADSITEPTMTFVRIIDELEEQFFGIDVNEALAGYNQAILQSAVDAAVAQPAEEKIEPRVVILDGAEDLDEAVISRMLENKNNALYVMLRSEQGNRLAKITITDNESRLIDCSHIETMSVSSLKEAVLMFRADKKSVAVISDNRREMVQIDQKDALLFSTERIKKSAFKDLPFEMALLPFAFTYDHAMVKEHAGINNLFTVSGKLIYPNLDYIVNAFGNSMSQAFQSLLKMLGDAMQAELGQRMVKVAA